MFRPRSVDDKMPFMEHLGELRIRIVRSLIALLVGLVIAFPFADRIVDWLSRPIFRWARHVLPSLSETEREAIEAGDVWWDADLFSGKPDWTKLLA